MKGPKHVVGTYLYITNIVVFDWYHMHISLPMCLLECRKFYCISFLIQNEDLGLNVLGCSWSVLCHKQARIHLNPTYLSACALSCLLCFKSSSSIPLNGMKTCCTSGCVSNRLKRKEIYERLVHLFRKYYSLRYLCFWF